VQEAGPHTAVPLERRHVYVPMVTRTPVQISDGNHSLPAAGGLPPLGCMPLQQGRAPVRGAGVQPCAVSYSHAQGRRVSLRPARPLLSRDTPVLNCEAGGGQR
jgi:hypothetical protein